MGAPARSRASRTKRVAAHHLANRPAIAITRPKSIPRRIVAGAGDDRPFPEPPSSEILETQRTLTHHKLRFVSWQVRNVAEPRFYWVEPNAGNRASPAPAVVRFDSLPDHAYRLTVEAMLAPARVAFADMLAPGPEISIRQEHVEIYLLPIARGLLTSCELWKNPETKSAAIKAGETAEMKYANLASTTLATPANEVGTPHGF